MDPSHAKSSSDTRSSPYPQTQISPSVPIRNTAPTIHSPAGYMFGMPSLNPGPYPAYPNPLSAPVQSIQSHPVSGNQQVGLPSVPTSAMPVYVSSQGPVYTMPPGVFPPALVLGAANWQSFVPHVPSGAGTFPIGHVSAQTHGDSIHKQTTSAEEAEEDFGSFLGASVPPPALQTKPRDYSAPLSLSLFGEEEEEERVENSKSERENLQTTIPTLPTEVFEKQETVDELDEEFGDFAEVELGKFKVAEANQHLPVTVPLPITGPFASNLVVPQPISIKEGTIIGLEVGEGKSVLSSNVPPGGQAASGLEFLRENNSPGDGGLSMSGRMPPETEVEEDDEWGDFTDAPSVPPECTERDFKSFEGLKEDPVFRGTGPLPMSLFGETEVETGKGAGGEEGWGVGLEVASEEPESAQSQVARNGRGLDERQEWKSEPAELLSKSEVEVDLPAPKKTSENDEELEEDEFGEFTESASKNVLKTPPVGTKCLEIPACDTPQGLEMFTKAEAELMAETETGAKERDATAIWAKLEFVQPSVLRNDLNSGSAGEDLQASFSSDATKTQQTLSADFKTFSTTDVIDSAFDNDEFGDFESAVPERKPPNVESFPSSDITDDSSTNDSIDAKPETDSKQMETILQESAKEPVIELSTAKPIPLALFGEDEVEEVKEESAQLPKFSSTIFNHPKPDQALKMPPAGPGNLMDILSTLYDVQESETEQRRNSPVVSTEEVPSTGFLAVGDKALENNDNQTTSQDHNQSRTILSREDVGRKIDSKGSGVLSRTSLRSNNDVGEDDCAGDQPWIGENIGEGKISAKVLKMAVSVFAPSNLDTLEALTQSTCGKSEDCSEVSVEEGAASEAMKLEATVEELILEGRIREAWACHVHVVALRKLPGLKTKYVKALEGVELEAAAAIRLDVQAAESCLSSQEDVNRWMAKKPTTSQEHAECGSKEGNVGSELQSPPESSDEVILPAELNKDEISVSQSQLETTGANEDIKGRNFVESGRRFVLEKPTDSFDMTLDLMADVLGRKSNDPRAAAFSSCFPATQLIELAQNDLRAATLLHCKALLYFKILNSTSWICQRDYVEAWTTLAKVCTAILEQAVLVLNQLNDLQDECSFSSSSKGQAYLMSVSQVYGVLIILSATVQLYAPWLLSMAIDEVGLWNTVKSGIAVWDTKLKSFVSESLTLHPIDHVALSEPGCAQELSDIAVRYWMEALLESRPHSVLCGLCLLPAVAFDPVPAVEWNGRHYLLPVANLWVNCVSSPLPVLSHQTLS